MQPFQQEPTTLCLQRRKIWLVLPANSRPIPDTPNGSTGVFTKQALPAFGLQTPNQNSLTRQLAKCLMSISILSEKGEALKPPMPGLPPEVTTPVA
jgi:hypothetical protein